MNAAWVATGILKGTGKIRNEALVAEGLPSLVRQMELAKINNPRRIAAFLATIAVESYFEYSVLQGGSNIPTGISKGYTGRGYIQLTGSANYESASNFLGVNLLAHPELAQSLDWSARIATWYWTVARPKTNAYADNLQMGKVDAMIGFPAGPADQVRAKMFGQALKVLTGSIPEGITSTR